MADTLTPIPIKTKVAGDAVVKIVDTGGVNQLAVDSGGRITAKISDGTDTLAINTDGSINVQVGTPTNPTVQTITYANLAAGASANLDTAVVGAGTKYLKQVVVSASVPLKARIGVYDGTTFTPKIVIFVQANSHAIWTTPHTNYISFNFDGTNDVWRVEITNMDNANTADVYATIMYEG